MAVLRLAAPAFEIEFDERQFVGGGVYLLANVLERFWAAYLDQQLLPIGCSNQYAKGDAWRMASEEPGSKVLI